jgi:ribonuclease P protein component
LGLVIPKKNARRAVLRNLLKRIAREAFRQVRTDLPRYDLVLRLAKPLVSASADDDGSKRRAWRVEIDLLLAQLPK